ncbi:hypothetical protein TC41_0597 [Alicyclobacillus acidocaldarius subsp. acidocaldarius Tc-4-1]|uniref:Uncharacterized protein n=1 Tax=Alicyclobacillus acidocaldarius (strain Tc-4-1) TaxID=1048834 RepID=F8ID90_ALIAT|nr:hypothetical protein TC41_0597 [Alicyclobacillus acidocaldarius subsp. acidocaldarius Tc-4-1]
MGSSGERLGPGCVGVRRMCTYVISQFVGFQAARECEIRDAR